ncbi:hypothetical protein PO909_005151 [Leuciscus waleckii]
MKDPRLQISVILHFSPIREEMEDFIFDKMIDRSVYCDEMIDRSVYCDEMIDRSVYCDEMIDRSVYCDKMIDRSVYIYIHSFS